MNHQEIKDKLLDFRDPEFAQAERLEIETHLSACQECQNTLKNWSAVRAALYTPSTPAAHSEWFVNRVMDRLVVLEESETVSSKSWLPDWLMPVLGYGFAFFLMFLAITYQESNLNAETVLLADVASQTPNWVFSNEIPNMDHLITPQEEQ